MNNITITGNITRAPELKTLGSKANVKVGVAVNRRFQKGGEWEEVTSYFDVIAWGTLAENVSTSLTKGSAIIVTGRLDQRSYDDKDGNKRTVFEIVADAIGPDLTRQVATVERVGQPRTNLDWERATRAVTSLVNSGFAEEPF
jgi:single-strand DNA-binding protein